MPPDTVNPETLPTETLPPETLPPAIAYLLVSHGSRDPRPQVAAAQLAQRLAAILAVPVGAVQLECAPLPLHQQIVEFGQSLPPAPHQPLVILPLFLLPGVHVMEDLPAEIAQAQASLDRPIQVAPYLGTQAGLQQLVTAQMATLDPTVDAWILLAHGSRRSQGNQPIADLAQAVGALPAYWSVAPSLESRLPELIQMGVKKIGILPYFLFAGGITDAIAQTIDELATQFPDLTLHPAEPLGTNLHLADLLAHSLADLPR